MFPVSGSSYVYVPPSTGGGSTGGGTTTGTYPLTTLQWTTLNSTIETIQKSITSLESGGGGGGSSDTTIQAWIRGTGMFRRVANLMGTQAMTDNHWQSFMVVTDLGGFSSTLDVVKPTDALSTSIIPLAGIPNMTSDLGNSTVPPRGAWTLVANLNQVASFTLRFGEQMFNVFGYNGVTNSEIAVTLNSASPTSFTIPKGRVALLMYVATGYYYLNIW